MKRLYLFLGKRLLFVIPQLFGITLVSFLFLQLIPGDPAVFMAGHCDTLRFRKLKSRVGTG